MLWLVELVFDRRRSSFFSDFFFQGAELVLRFDATLVRAKIVGAPSVWKRHCCGATHRRVVDVSGMLEAGDHGKLLLNSALIGW